MYINSTTARLKHMSNVTITNKYGAREIAPESLWPGLTRYNSAVASWHPLLKRAVGEKAVASTGVWLPSAESSEQDLTALRSRIEIGNIASQLAIEESIVDDARAITNGIFVTGNGCWVNHGLVAGLRIITEFDAGHNILEEDQRFDELRQCDTPSCQYPRHYDFSFNVPSGRRELVYPDSEFFLPRRDGIITAWGDALPPVDYSRQELYKFRHKSVPFVSTADSLLTANGISQICLVPSTGCWFVRMYYMTPTDQNSPKGWQYDGYGRLRVPSLKAKEHNYIKYSTLAHRIVWLVSGRPLADSKKFVLNHRCGFRPCANPDHLEEMTPQENNIHGQMMETASAMVDGSMDIEDGIRQLSRASRVIGYNPNLIEEYWALKDLVKL